jgi:hypothetical protein
MAWASVIVTGTVFGVPQCYGVTTHIPLVSEMRHAAASNSAYSLEDYTQIKQVMAKLD